MILFIFIEARNSLPLPLPFIFSSPSQDFAMTSFDNWSYWFFSVGCDFCLQLFFLAKYEIQAPMMRFVAELSHRGFGPCRAMCLFAHDKGCPQCCSFRCCNKCPCCWEGDAYDSDAEVDDEGLGLYVSNLYGGQEISDVGQQNGFYFVRSTDIRTEGSNDKPAVPCNCCADLPPHPQGEHFNAEVMTDKQLEAYDVINPFDSPQIFGCGLGLSIVVVPNEARFRLTSYYSSVMTCVNDIVGSLLLVLLLPLIRNGPQRQAFPFLWAVQSDSERWNTQYIYILCKLLYNVLKTIALFQVGPFVYKAALQRSGDLKRLVLEMFAQDKAESAYFGFTLLFTAIMCHCIISIQFGFADFLREVSFGEVDILRPFCSNVSTMDCYPDFWQNFSSITSVCTFEDNCI
jgi:hypothetical protein